MDIPLLSVISVSATVGTVIFAFLLWRATRNATIHRALLDMHEKYASVEMRNKVDNLWKFYKKCGGKTELLPKAVKEKVEKKLRNNFKAILNKKSSATKYGIYDVENSLRFVLHFYLHMADLYFNDIIGEYRLKTTKKRLFNYWTEADLRIIPKILIPLTDVKGEQSGYTEEERTPKYLKRFYDNARDFSDP